MSSMYKKDNFVSSTQQDMNNMMQKSANANNVTYSESYGQASSFQDQHVKAIQNENEA